MGCTAKPNKPIVITQIEKSECIIVPPSLFRLTPLTVKELRTQKDVAEAYLNLYGAYQECVNRMQSIRNLVIKQDKKQGKK